MEFDVFNIGDTIFVPSLKVKEVPQTCPDCLGEKTWRIMTPSAKVDIEIPCPRCGGGVVEWLIPKRHEWIVEVNERVIASIGINHGRFWGSEDIKSRVTYRASCGNSVYQKDACPTREAAEARGAEMLTERKASQSEQDRKDKENRDRRRGADIIAAITSNANERAKDIEDKIDRLKEEMLEAIRYPNLYGPTLSKATFNQGELTSENLAAWLNKLLNKADLDGWSEEELHEATCNC